MGSLNYSYQGFHWKEQSFAPQLANPSKVSRNSTFSNALSPYTHQASSPVDQSMPPVNFSDYFPAHHKGLLNFNLSVGTNQEDPNFFRIKNLFTRMKTVQKKEGRELSSIPATELYSLALRWKNLVKELLSLPEKSATKELLALYYEVLVEYQYFYRMDLGTMEERWPEFLQQQEVSNVLMVFGKIAMISFLFLCFPDYFCIFTDL